MEAHRGSVEVQSTVGVGTVMTVTIPGARTASTEPQVAMSPELAKELEHLERVRDLRAIPIAATAS